MAEVTEEQIVQYAESVGYRRVSRREFELVAGDAAPHGTRVPLGVMTRRAQEYFDAIDDELGTVHEPEETTAVQLQRFVDELRDVSAWLDGLTEWMVRLFLSRTSVLSREEFLHKIERKDWWLSSDEALEMGFVDAIG